MMADSDQPMIWQLDNYLLERRFATSFCQSRAEWERRQGERDEADSDWEPLSPLPASRGFADDQRVWQNSFTNMSSLTEMPPWESVNVMLFAVGGHMAELVHDLRSDADTDELVQQLHVRFDELRVFLKEQRDLLIIRSSIGDFAETLSDVAQIRDDLRDKCADLETKLDFLEKRYAKHLGQDLEAML